MAPKNINDILNSMGAGGNTSALTPYSGGKGDTRLVNETIDERILRLLGLDDVFDIDYGTYKTLLRERLAAARMTKSKIPVEEDELLRNEFKRIRGKEGRFKVKKKKITASSAGLGRSSSAIVKRAKISALSPARGIRPDSLKGEGQSGVLENLKTINQTLDKILKGIISQGQSDRKRREKERTASERRKAQERESGLEKPLEVAKSIVRKVVAPFQGILDRVFRFLGFTFLGWLVGKYEEIQKWYQSNKEKITVIGRFLKDWWPTLLGAYVLFATPFGKFVRGTLKMLRFFIPQIVRLIASNPLLAGLTAATIGGIAKIKESERMKPLVEKDQAEIDKTLSSKDAPWYEKLGAGFANQSLNAPGGPKNPIGAPMPGSMYSRGGSIFGFRNGAGLFSGLVGRDTGTSVSGFGQDTQAFPIDGGGVGVLKPGEVVMNTGAVNAIGADKLLSWNSQFGGPNANKPVNFTYNGGGVVGMQGGGIIGALGNLISQKTKGLGFGGVRAGFTGMGPKGFKAISSGEGFKLPTQKSLFGKGSRPVLGRGAYNAPTMRGAGRYMKPGGGIVKSIVPRGAIGSSLVDIFEPQSVVKPATFDKGRELANKLMSGKYANSPLANQLRAQLVSGQSVNTMSKVSGLGRGAAAMKLFGNLGKLGSKFTRIPLLMDMLFPDPTSAYDQISGPNAYYNAPGYKGPKPAGYQSGGVIPIQGGTRGADNLKIPPMFLQPGERLAVLTKRSVEMGAVDAVNKTLAELDPNSRPAKSQNLKRDVGPKVTFINLPTETVSAPTKGGGISPGKPKLPEFNVIMDHPKRMEVAASLGIADLV